LKAKLAALRQEAINLAQQKKDFVVAKSKAQELNDPNINNVRNIFFHFFFAYFSNEFLIKILDFLREKNNFLEKIEILQFPNISFFSKF